MQVDLHCHSHHSDGMFSPQQLLENAKNNDIKIFSITDHDNIEAYSYLSNQDNDIQLLSGIEFSTSWNRIGVHIVGLNFNVHSDELLAGIAYQKNARIQRAKEISKRLEKVGLYDAFETLITNNTHSIGRPDFAQLLVDKGICKDCNHAFKKILGAGKIGDIKNHWLDMNAIINTITKAGGIAVLAHPLKYKLTNTKLKRLIHEFKLSGGQGIEVLSGFQTSDQIKFITHLCQKYEMLASLGSDFHFPNRWSRLGCDSSLIKACDFIWENLKIKSFASGIQ